jgi:hypothetical protein
MGFVSDHLHHRADSSGLSAATSLSRADVMAVASAVGWLYIRERRSVSIFIDVHAVADSRSERVSVSQNPRYDT